MGDKTGVNDIYGVLYCEDKRLKQSPAARTMLWDLVRDSNGLLLELHAHSTGMRQSYLY